VLEASGIGDSRRAYEQILAEWFISRYDEAIVSLGFMVRSMNFNLKRPANPHLFNNFQTEVD
jgi:hypothetical protein